MPYKDLEQAREANREKARRHRERKKVTPDSNPLENVTPTTTKIVTPNPSDGWKDVEAFISRESPGMDNLERLQRIAGALGKYAGDVWFGVSGLTMEDIGSVIGTMEGKYCL